MYSNVATAIIRGISSIPVRVEADVSNGMPMFEMVGFLASEVKEARERVRTALRNIGYMLPAKRITVNLSPANIKKTGSGFDLPVAVAILSALGIVHNDFLSCTLIVGEIGLDGRIQPVQGILPMVADAGAHGFTHCMVPYENRVEAGMIKDIAIAPVKNMEQAVAVLNGTAPFGSVPESFAQASEQEKCPRTDERDTRGGTWNETERATDFSQINGQHFVRRASEVAAAGMHNLLMIGPPGAGKTMIARCIPTILPPLSAKERLELAKIYSVSGMLMQDEQAVYRRPFRSPHHTITPQGLTGGGMAPKPGEISLAHKGVLFLDELAEFQKSTLELLRQPMEEKQIHIARVQCSCSYPADFMLVAATNPCPCGAYPDMNRCRCTRNAIDRYLGKMSQPLLDRIDICVEAAPLTYEELTAQSENESSAAIRERVCGAWQIQKTRFAGSGIYFNSQIPADRLKEICEITRDEEEYLHHVYAQAGLSARSYHKILRVARTIADLSGERAVNVGHLSEAFCYRSFDKKYWDRR